MRQGTKNTGKPTGKDIPIRVVPIDEPPTVLAMGRNLIMLILLWALGGIAHATEAHRDVQIADPYIELRTGPGEGYPVFLVVERGERIELLKRKTDWFKVRTVDNTEGWVNRKQLERTLTPEGEKTRFKDVARMDFQNRRWGMGITTGDYGGAALIALFGGYAFTDNLSTELTVGQAVGSFSSSLSFKASLLSHPFPDWRVSPFFALGGGLIRTKPHTTLVKAENSSDAMAAVGVGFESYLSRRFVFRAEYNNYLIFSATNDHDQNEDVDEWKAGFAIFF